MNILYIGNKKITGTSFQRANALVRLGHNVSVYDIKEDVDPRPFSGILGAVNYRTGFRFMQPQVIKWVKSLVIRESKPDLIWIDHGELLGPTCLKILRSMGSPIVLYNNDDPTGKRDGQRFGTLLRALKYYDCCAVVREENVQEFKQHGVKNVIHVNRSYDEIAHKPFDNIRNIPEEFKSDVVFIGTWMKSERRDDFMLNLIAQEIPLSIWGNKWDRSMHWDKIKPFYRGPAIYNRDYIAALQGSKICLGLLSKGNRDLHTTRSFEIPFAGGLFCGERTREHEALYKDGVEAVFWSDVNECAQICKELLSNDKKRESIRLAGMTKVRELHAGNEDICAAIIDAAFN